MPEEFITHRSPPVIIGRPDDGRSTPLFWPSFPVSARVHLPTLPQPPGQGHQGEMQEIRLERHIRESARVFLKRPRFPSIPQILRGSDHTAWFQVHGFRAAGGKVRQGGFVRDEVAMLLANLVVGRARRDLARMAACKA
jgi:hypothetical protein